jgi:CxxC-x17-CxxC domain-containing protein
MGNFSRDNRRGYGSSRENSRGRDRFSGRSSGRSSRDRDSGRFGRDERKPLELHEVICAKCGKKTEVPFKPTGDKPVYCRECFDKQPNSRDSSSGISQEQYKEINTKLDKILEILDTLEMVDEEE